MRRARTPETERPPTAQFSISPVPAFKKSVDQKKCVSEQARSDVWLGKQKLICRWAATESHPKAPKANATPKAPKANANPKEPEAPEAPKAPKANANPKAP